jgi:membrane-anchored protein YejM (alkaline phosphatase superfamily)
MHAARPPPSSREASAEPGARHRRALLGFALGNVLAASLHAAGYLRTAPPGSGRALLALALAAQLGAAFVGLCALLLPLARGAAGRAALPAAAPLLVTALHLFFWVDRKVYAALGLHVNGLLLDLAISQGGLRAMDVGSGEWMGLAVRWTGILGAEIAAYAWLASRQAREPLAGSRGWVRAGAAVVLLLAAERTFYAAATLGGHGPGPAAAAAPAHGLERSLRLRVAEPPTLRYPRAPLDLAPDAPRPSLVWIVIESWRRDGFDPLRTPALWRWSREALRFRNHMSGGNASIVGVYSQFYGLHGNLVEPLVRAKQGPVLFRALRERGYRVRVVASPSIEYAGMHETIFADVADDVEGGVVGATPAERDRSATALARAFLKTVRPDEPFALVLFLDATHFPYFFDAARARFRPFEPELRYSELDRPADVEGVRNRYFNALAEVDRSAGEVLDAVEATGQAGRTVTIVTGDHGEQLFEHGRLGHQASLSPEETQTPLLLRVPGVPPADRTDLSRHVDLAPTFLGLLGARNPPGDYSVGRSLLHGPAPTWALLVGTMFEGVRTADGWTVEWETGAQALHARGGYRVRDAAYRELPGATPPDPGAVAAALADLQRFTR